MASNLDAFGSGLDLALDALTAPEARRREIRAAADALLREAEREIRAAGGRAPRHRTLVDGREVDGLDAIGPDTVEVDFVFAVGVPVEAIAAVLDLLRANSPVLTGRYAKSHHLFADGQDITDTMPIPQDQADAVKEFTIQPLVPYGRKVERWHAVYEGTTAMAQRRFDNQCGVYFESRSPLLDYQGGEFQRHARRRLSAQPNRLAAMRTERATRLPTIFFQPLGA